MTKRQWNMVLVAAATLALAIACTPEPPEEGLIEDLQTIMPSEPALPEAVVEAPEHTEVVYADDLANIVRITLAPGEEVPEHEAPYRVLFSVTSTELEVDRDGALEVIALEPGEIRDLVAGSYSLRNVGDRPLELVAAARTEAALPSYAEPSAADGSPGRMLLANDDVQVRELNLEPSATVDLPGVPLRVVYALEEAALEYATGSGDVEPVETETSVGHVRPGDDRSVANRGDEGVRLIMFEWLT